MSGTVSRIIREDVAGADQSSGNAIETPDVPIGDWLDSLITTHALKTSRSPAPAFTATPAAPPPRPTALGGPQSASNLGMAQDGEAGPPAPEPGPSDPMSVDRTASENATSPRQGAAESRDTGRSKGQLIRNAVAAIMRRQLALDGTVPSPDAGSASPASATADPAAGLQTRLGSGRAERNGAASTQPPSQPKMQGAIDLDPEASHAFDRLGQDLRSAIEALDRRGLANLDVDSESSFEGRHHSRLDLMTSLAPLSSDGTASRESLARILTSPEVPESYSETDPRAQALMGDVKALLDRFGPDSAMERLDRRMQDLMSKVENQIDAASPSSLIEDVSRRIDAIHASLQQPAGERRGLDHLVQAIEDRFVKARAASTDIERIEAMMNGLARRMEAARPEVDPAAMVALRAQIESLGERLDRSEANLASLDTVEHSLSGLFSQLERTRQAAIDAAGHAARTAARDTLREAMNNPVVTGASDRHVDLADKISREVQDLKLRHDASERRTQDALASLHQAIETLVQGQTVEAPATLRGAGTRMGEKADVPTSSGVAGIDDGALQPSPLARRSEAESDLADGLIEPGSDKAGRGAQGIAPDRAQTGAASIRSNAIPAPTLGSIGSSPFIAAARRAARATQASVVSSRKQVPPLDGDTIAFPSSSATPSPAAILDRARRYLTLRRRPILLSLAGLVLMLGALEAVRIGMDDSADQPPIADSTTISAPTEPTKVEPPPAQNDAPVDPPHDQTPPSRVENTIPADEAAAVAQQANPPSQQETAPDATKPAKMPNPVLAGLAPTEAGLGEGLKASALGGDAAAQYEAGVRYSEGRSVPHDAKTAAQWFAKAATQGLAPAQYRLGSAYEKGIGESRDPALATMWYERASSAGNIKAMHNLAVMSAEGATGKADYVKAAALFGKAAALGVRDSQYNLAILYARGLGVEQNPAKSYIWFAIAAAQGDDAAGKKRDEIAARLDAKSLDAAKAAAADFRPASPARSANDVVPPAEGWDAIVSPTSAVRPEKTVQKPNSPKTPAL